MSVNNTDTRHYVLYSVIRAVIVVHNIYKYRSMIDYRVKHKFASNDTMMLLLLLQVNKSLYSSSSSS